MVFAHHHQEVLNLEHQTLVNGTIVPSTQQLSVLYLRLSVFNKRTMERALLPIYLCRYVFVRQQDNTYVDALKRIVKL